MKLHLVTIVLDGMPFVSWHYPILRQLKLDWHWHVVEGVAAPRGCTSWCAEIAPRLSKDGTTQYLKDLAGFDKRVTHIAYADNFAWPGKVSMFNEALSGIEDGCYILIQVDSDEIWSADQLDTVHGLLRWTEAHANCCHFRCRYFVGPDLTITSKEGFGNHAAYEWKRAWRVERGVRFATHEPPCLEGFDERPWTQDQTSRMGLVFDHFAYATREQMAFKQTYYAGRHNPNRKLYARAVEGWEALQKATMPVSDLSRYLLWVGPGVTVDRVPRVAI